MFVVIYSFHVKKDCDASFRAAWQSLTQLIYEYEGSLGSRLHDPLEGKYLAYAQWPDEETWEKSGENLPKSADKFRAEMRKACLKIEVLDKLNVANDLTKAVPFK